MQPIVRGSPITSGISVYTFSMHGTVHTCTSAHIMRGHIAIRCCTMVMHNIVRSLCVLLTAG